MMDVVNATNSIEDATSNFRTHLFSKTIFGIDIQFSVLKMDQSVLIWIGFKEPKNFNDLSLGFQSKFNSIPLSAHLLGNATDVISKTLTSKLAKKLEKPVYLSYNISDNQMTPEIIKALVNEIDANPDCF